MVKSQRSKETNLGLAVDYGEDGFLKESKECHV